MEDRRQLLTGELRIRPRFIPADSAHWMVLPALRYVAAFPACRPRSPCLVDKPRHGVVPRQLSLRTAESVLPQIPPTVAAGGDELLELFVGDLEPVDVIIRKR